MSWFHGAASSKARSSERRPDRSAEVPRTFWKTPEAAISHQARHRNLPVQERHSNSVRTEVVKISFRFPWAKRLLIWRLSGGEQLQCSRIFEGFLADNRSGEPCTHFATLENNRTGWPFGEATLSVLTCMNLWHHECVKNMDSLIRLFFLHFSTQNFTIFIYML